MVVHICNFCDKKFKQKGHLDDHLNKQKKCYNQLNNINSLKKSKKIQNNPNPIQKIQYLDEIRDSENKNNECPFCSKCFSTKCNLNKHVKRSCKVVKSEEKEKQNIFDKLMKEFEEKHNNQIKELQEQNKKLAEIVIKLSDKKHDDKSDFKENNTNSNNTINNTNSNNTFNQQQIVMVGHGKEDITKLTKKDFVRVLGKGYSAVLQLTDDMHFSEKCPEFHNVYIPSMKEKYGMIYNGKTWDLINKDELVENIYADKKDIIDEKFDEFYDALSKSKKDALERWFDDDMSANKSIDKIKDKIKLLLYNKRHIPMKTKQQLQNILNSNI